LHLAAASQSKLCELDSLELTNMVRDQGQREKQMVREREKQDYSPIAQVLVWMAWQGRACAASQRLPGDVFTEHSPGVPRHGTSTGESSCNSSTREGIVSIGEEARRSTRSEANGGGESRKETPIRSPRRGRFRDFQLEALEEEVEGSILPKVAAVIIAGVGRNGRATAEAIQIASELESEREGRVGAGLGRFDRPRPEPGWFSRARWAGWASRPVGPAGQLGQEASWSGGSNGLLPIGFNSNFKI
jgi:hypothetical protein